MIANQVSPWHRELLKEAFLGDPMCTYLFPDVRLRGELLVEPFLFMVRLMLRCGEVIEAEGENGLIAYTGRFSRSKSLISQVRAGGLGLLARVGVRSAARTLRYDLHAHRLHRRLAAADDYYVGLVAVHPRAQGKGLGGRLMEQMLAGVEGGRGVYLESTNPRNLPFYERFGFVNVGACVVPGTTAGIWAMRRKGGG